jgi:hypothetical protein
MWQTRYFRNHFAHIALAIESCTNLFYFIATLFNFFSLFFGFVAVIFVSFDTFE